MASMKKDCIAHHSKLVYWFLLLEWQNDSYIRIFHANQYFLMLKELTNKDKTKVRTCENSFLKT